MTPPLDDPKLWMTLCAVRGVGWGGVWCAGGGRGGGGGEHASKK